MIYLQRCIRRVVFYGYTLRDGRGYLHRANVTADSGGQRRTVVAIVMIFRTSRWFDILTSFERDFLGREGITLRWRYRCNGGSIELAFSVYASRRSYSVD